MACVVCLEEEVEGVDLGCGCTSRMCRACIERWGLEANGNKCPVCWQVGSKLPVRVAFERIDGLVEYHRIRDPIERAERARAGLRGVRFSN